MSQSKVYGLCLVWLQAVPRSTDVRRLARQQRVRAYFYGLDNSLSPSLTTLSFDDVEVFRIGGDIVRGQWVNEGCAPPTDRVCVFVQTSWTTIWCGRLGVNPCWIPSGSFPSHQSRNSSTSLRLCLALRPRSK